MRVKRTVKNSSTLDFAGVITKPITPDQLEPSSNATTMSRTQAEFSPDFFRSLFRSGTGRGKGFLGVSIRAIEEGRSKLDQAVAAEDATAISETRHSIGPSLTQWGVVTLEGDLREIDPQSKAPVDGPGSGIQRVARLLETAGNRALNAGSFHQKGPSGPFLV